ncbi:MAG: exopolyphosphatase/guanosine-5'-triphosphate,3'-diphosphate pyrophosphatase [Flavobacteriaceae bacterium]|jgi:exopolyphosphatase/guanosine-5'-triphosphate,3'-diphosphate pyrophosphatase
MKRAVIDLGTNTFNLLIAEVEGESFTVIFKTKEAVLLGMGGINEGILAEDAIQRAMTALENFLKITDEHGILPGNISAFGTSALRAASNAEKFCSLVMGSFGINIDIISGEYEAQLIYQGVKWSYDFSAPAVIMDIGGGSSEFIHATKTGVRDIVSFDIGVSRIFQQLNKPTVYGQEEVDSIYQFMNSREMERLSSFSCDTLIGSSGSFETFYEMINQTKFEASNNIIELNIEEFMVQLDWAIKSTLDERMNHPWIIPIRKKMLPIAALQIKWAIQKIGVKRMLLSSYSLKEGGLIEKK